MPTEQPYSHPIDPDVDLHDARQRRETRHHTLRITTVVAAGGGLGALARYGLAILLPHSAGTFPVATLLTNALGCALLGALMVCIDRRFQSQVLLRPFVGVGILGGFTTFSTFAVDSSDLLAAHPGRALLNLFSTPLVTLLAVIVGSLLAERVLRGRLSRRLRESA